MSADVAAGFVSIDVSKARLDCAVLVSEAVTQSKLFDNDSAGHEQLLRGLRDGECQPGLIVVEATGGYESAMVAMLATAKLPVAVVNPRQVRDVAKATGVLARTDAVDARILAQFGRAIRPQIPGSCGQATVIRRGDELRIEKRCNRNDSVTEVVTLIRGDLNSKYEAQFITRYVPAYEGHPEERGTPQVQTRSTELGCSGASAASSDEPLI